MLTLVGGGRDHVIRTSETTFNGLSGVDGSLLEPQLPPLIYDCHYYCVHTVLVHDGPILPRCPPDPAPRVLKA